MDQMPTDVFDNTGDDAKLTMAGTDKGTEKHVYKINQTESRLNSILAKSWLAES